MADNPYKNPHRIKPQITLGLHNIISINTLSIRQYMNLPKQVVRLSLSVTTRCITINKDNLGCPWVVLVHCSPLH